METQAFNNFHHEMVECLSYYSIAIQGLENYGDKTTVAEYKKVVDTLLFRLFKVGRFIDMKDEASQGRILMTMRQFMQEIDNNMVNISILLENYAYQCKAVVEDPYSRVLYWLNKATSSQ